MVYYRLFHMWQHGEHLKNVWYGLFLHDYGEMKNKKWKYQEDQ